MNEKTVRITRAAELLPELAFDSDDGLFLLADRSAGFGFVTEPLSGADDALQSRLTVLINTQWPKGTSVSFSLSALSDISRELSAIGALRGAAGDGLSGETVRRRIAFLEDCTEGFRDPALAGVLRTFRLYITVKIPISGPMISDTEMPELISRRSSFLETLKTVGFRPLTLTPERLVPLFSRILEGDKVKADGRMPGTDSDRPVRESLLSPGEYIEAGTDTVRTGTRVIAALSAKRLPERMYFGRAVSFAGDLTSGTRGISGEFLLTMNLFYPDQEKIRERTEARRQWTVNQATGPMMRFLPQLAIRKKGFDVLFEAVNGGDAIVRASFTLLLIAGDADGASRRAEEARTYLREIGFEMMRDRFFMLPVFLNFLPFGADREAVQALFRYKTLNAGAAVAFLPVFATWSGTGTPAMNFVSRTGGLMNMSLYDSGTNYNLCIAAQSGSGKSFLVNELISSCLSLGGRCWVIDVGRSYEKLCESYGGRFMQFGKDSSICLNPFELVRSYGEEADILTALLAAMAAPTEKLTDLQIACLKRALSSLWDRYGRGITVDLVAETLKKDSDSRVRDIGRQLFPFTSEGEYGKYFTGHNTVAFESDLTVLELEELKGRKHLQQVVLLMLIYQIQQSMYLGERDRRKVVIIDEAWDLLTSGEVGSFLETGYRRFRKYGGAAVTVTQSVNDLYSTDAGRAIVENSANLYLLGQKGEVVNQLEKEQRLPLSPGGYELLKTVHTVTGHFSEIFFMTDYGSGIGRLVVDDFHKLLYSTKAEDVEAIRQLRESGLSVGDAIREILRQRGKAGAAGA